MISKSRMSIIVVVLGLSLTLVVLLLFAGQSWAGTFTLSVPLARPASTSQPAFSANTFAEEQSGPLAARAMVDAGDVREVFTNAWSYSTIGLVYDPGRNYVRYAHESQSSSHNPTIYDVDVPPTHTLLFSLALSTQNSSWPWQIDNRTGAGYDFIADTYFLPDYNGDLSYADDNIVEIDSDGNILNAWEMDDEVSSNDSSDGSEIDSIIDIAVVPGTPTRYFVTAAYDDNVVYEVDLTRTGTWWTPNSWRTVATYTLPIWSETNDNLSVDYDAENQVLYHSSWDTTTVLITDLNMQPITLAEATFDCPGAGGYNSGVTFIEGSNPPEVWVTDFSSDKTTRCESPLGGQAAASPQWGKWVAGQLWEPDLVISTQTQQVVQVTDVVTTTQPFTLTESWNPDRLALLNVDVFPPVGQVITGVGSLVVMVPAGPPETVTINKWFHVEPCDWITTTLEEELLVGGDAFFETRAVTITKLSPELHIDSTYEQQVFAGDIVSFTLTYSNAGGFENNVWISNTFPISAPFIYADPFPSAIGPGGIFARWDIGELAQGDAGRIEVYVFISETVATSDTISIWDGIFDHLDELQEETLIELHGNTVTFSMSWEKSVNGEPWHPGVLVTLQTSQTLVIQDIIDPQGITSGFSLIEEWDPEELALLASWSIDPPAYETYVSSLGPGLWGLLVPLGVDLGPLTITKEFRVEPCTWPETILWESFENADGVRIRPVTINKQQPDLWIDSFFDVSAYSGDEVQFVLTYGNDGGFENQAWITNTFPAEAIFVASDPLPDVVGPDERWVSWDIGALPQGAEEQITVTVEITSGLPPSTTIEVWDGIFNHVGELVDEVVTGYHVPPPTWHKWVNGQEWRFDHGVTVQTSDTITVTDVISTRSAVAIVEHWDPERLTLMTYMTDSQESGIVLSNADFLSWEFPGGAPGLITVTKIFYIEPCTWTYTVLWEELWVEDIEWERRPLQIDKMSSDLWIDSTYEPDILPGQLVTITLTYGNIGGLESRAWVTSTFPSETTFVRSDPAVTAVDPNGRWAYWDVGALAQNAKDHITVTVAVTESISPDTVVHVYGYVYDHKDIEHDWTDIVLLRGPSIYLPLLLQNFD